MLENYIKCDVLDLMQLIAYVMIIAVAIIMFMKWIRGNTGVGIAAATLGGGISSALALGGGIGRTDGAGRKGRRVDHYDEYDAADAIKEIDMDFVYDNMIVDGNNFLHRLFQFENPNLKNPNTEQRFTYLEKSIELLYNEMPNRKIFFVMKDPDVHEEDVMKYLVDYSGDSIRTKFKSYFTKLLSKYPTVRVVMAYGKAKSRDDFTCIHLANILGSNTILLSRDRYRDVTDIDADNTKVNIVVYGKKAASWNKKFKKPFMYADKATVVDSLVGFTFSKDAITLMYKKHTSRKSAASDHVLNILVKPDETKKKEKKKEKAKFVCPYADIMWPPSDTNQKLHIISEDNDLSVFGHEPTLTK